VQKKFFVFITLIILLINISYFKLVLGTTFIVLLESSLYIISLPFLIHLSFKHSGKNEWMYIFVMSAGLIFHSIINEIQELNLRDSFQWIFLVVLIILSHRNKSPQIILKILLLFFIVHCTLAIIENKTKTNFLNFRFVEGYSVYTDSKDFRAFGLMEHPLQSANVTLIIMSFIMISKEIKWKLKIILLTIGTLAILSFNARIAIIICFCLLIYRYILYNLKPIYIICLGVIIYTLFISDISLFLQQNNNIFGRLAEKNNLTDSSSLARIMSYVYFWDAGWNIQDILIGGRIIYMPGTNYSLENGILLTISWWGWIVGLAKVILELIISYKCLNKYNTKDKWMIMIACWGTAFANNNSLYTFVFAFFIISFIGFDSLTNLKNNKSFYYLKNFK
jgi:hypothetical protein